jgi:hypothetical protein
MYVTTEYALVVVISWAYTVSAFVRQMRGWCRLAALEDEEACR